MVQNRHRHVNCNIIEGAKESPRPTGGPAIGSSIGYRWQQGKNTYLPIAYRNNQACNWLNGYYMNTSLAGPPDPGPYVTIQ